MRHFYKENHIYCAKNKRNNTCNKTFKMLISKLLLPPVNIEMSLCKNNSRKSFRPCLRRLDMLVLTSWQKHPCFERKHPATYGISCHLVISQDQNSLKVSMSHQVTLFLKYYFENVFGRARVSRFFSCWTVCNMDFHFV